MNDADIQMLTSQMPGPWELLPSLRLRLTVLELAIETKRVEPHGVSSVIELATKYLKFIEGEESCPVSTP